MIRFLKILIFLYPVACFAWVPNDRYEQGAPSLNEMLSGSEDACSDWGVWNRFFMSHKEKVKCEKLTGISYESRDPTEQELKEVEEEKRIAVVDSLDLTSNSLDHFEKRRDLIGGDCSGDENYALELYEKKKYSEAMDVFKCLKSPLAHAQLGYMYEKGYGVSVDFSQAIKYYRKSSKKGFALAERYLGLIYVDGRKYVDKRIGIRRNISKGVRYLRKALGKGDYFSSYLLAKIYASDDYGVKDLQIAYEMSIIAKDNGVKEVGNLYEKLENDLKDYEYRLAMEVYEDNIKEELNNKKIEQKRKEEFERKKEELERKKEREQKEINIALSSPENRRCVSTGFINKNISLLEYRGKDREGRNEFQVIGEIPKGECFFLIKEEKSRSSWRVKYKERYAEIDDIDLNDYAFKPTWLDNKSNVKKLFAADPEASLRMYLLIELPKTRQGAAFLGMLTQSTATGNFLNNRGTLGDVARANTDKNFLSSVAEGFYKRLLTFSKIRNENPSWGFEDVLFESGSLVKSMFYDDSSIERDNKEKSEIFEYVFKNKMSISNIVEFEKKINQSVDICVKRQSKLPPSKRISKDPAEIKKHCINDVIIGDDKSLLQASNTDSGKLSDNELEDLTSDVSF